jgi:hypothetical protein
MTARQADDYVPPARGDVVTISSDRVGVTNGLLLKFPQIHAVGDLSLVDRPRIAIVGARKASTEGRRRAAQLARDLAKAGVVVVSGLAEGIDYAAHTSAIDHGGKTIAVIGTPLDKVYQPSTRLFSASSIATTCCCRRSRGATSSSPATSPSATGSWRGWRWRR